MATSFRCVSMAADLGRFSLRFMNSSITFSPLFWQTAKEITERREFSARSPKLAIQKQNYVRMVAFSRTVPASLRPTFISFSTRDTRTWRILAKRKLQRGPPHSLTPPCPSCLLVLRQRFPPPALPDINVSFFECGAANPFLVHCARV